MRQNRLILTIASYISVIFTPFYLPLMGLLALFVFSYLSMLSWGYKLHILLSVWIFTCLLPTTLIRLYSQYQGWSLLKLVQREARMVPYIISIACYFACLYVMQLSHVSYIIKAIVVAALVVQILCAIINHWWKISIHTAAIGGTTGAVAAFSLIFDFYPLWWLCLLILFAGVLGTSRMLLRIHTLGQIVGGFLIGVVAGFVGVVI